METVNKTLRFPKELVSQVKKLAVKDSRSFSNMVFLILKERVEAETQINKP